LGGRTLAPGTYDWAAAIGLTGKLTLQGGTDAVWTFNIGGAFTTTADSKIEFDGGGSSANVQWVVTGAITLGANSLAIGAMKATGAITVGANAECGSLDSDAAITLGAGAKCDSLVARGAITVGKGAVYLCGNCVEYQCDNSPVVCLNVGSVADCNCDCTGRTDLPDGSLCSD
jgi:hypothetical protein